MTTRTILTFMILCCSYVLTAQEALIKGIIKDKTSGNPVAGATVYVNNTTYARICDAAGVFVFDKYPALPFELTVSAVGYETGVLKITADHAGHSLQLSLQPRIVHLGEVKVSAPERDGWAKYGQRFTEELIGYSGFAAQCKLMNKKAVQFRFDPDEGILKAWSDEPLLIRNKATGYEITYWLGDFELDMFKNKLYYKGYAHFREMQVSGKAAGRIEANRRAAFNGSFYHFVRALYKGKPLEEGFEIRVLKRMDEDQTGPYIPLSADTFAWSDTARFRQLFDDMYATSPLAMQMAAKAMETLQEWKLDASGTTPLRLKGWTAPEDSTIFSLVCFCKNRRG